MKDAGLPSQLSPHSFRVGTITDLLEQGVPRCRTESGPTDLPEMVEALQEVLSLEDAPSSGKVVTFDLNAVGVDVGSFPIDELLDFRRENLKAHRKYVTAARRFAVELARMLVEEQELAFQARQSELDEIAASLRRVSRKAWKKPASFVLTLSGSVWTLVGERSLGCCARARSSSSWCWFRDA